MVRTKKHNGADYILIDTDIMLYENGEVVSIVPVQVQVRLKDISEKRQKELYKYTSMYFDRTFHINKLQHQTEVKEKKNWFSRVFSK